MYSLPLLRTVISYPCLGLMVMLLIKAVSVSAAPILWNRLGSTQEVLNSAYGPDLGFYGGGTWPDVVGNPAFVPGAFGNALTIGPGSYGIYDREHTVVWNNLNQYLNPARGTIEVWYKQTQNPVGYSRGVYRIFDGSYGLGSGMNFTSETIPNTRLYFGLEFGSGNYTALSYDISAFNGTWIHLAGVWDRDGIGGSLDKLRLYVNGNVAAASTVAGWGNQVGQQADIGGGNDGNIANKFALDNLKVFDIARTDFSDRFFEAAAVPEPRSAVLLVLGLLSLCRRGFKQKC